VKGNGISSVLRIGRIRLVWVFLVVLATFVIFVECIATVGGSPDPISRPPAYQGFETPSPGP
jgi:hypothetical protein